MSLEGHAALVTGGAQGLGREIVSALVGSGARVVVLDSNPQKGIEMAQSFGPATQRVCFLPADISVKVQVAEAVRSATKAGGPIDILVNNAAIWQHNTMLDVTESDWDRMFAVNVKGALFCAQILAPAMIERRAGKILNVASIAGVNPWLGWAAYQTSKAAMIMLSRILAAELKDFNVQVIAACPGAIRTPMLDTIEAVEGGDWSHAADPAVVARMILSLVDPFEQTATGQVVDGAGKSIL